MPAQSKRQRSESAKGAPVVDVTPARDLKPKYDARPDQRSMAEIMDDENAAAFAAGHTAGRKTERAARSSTASSSSAKRASGRSSGSRSAPRSSGRRASSAAQNGAGILLGAFAWALFINYVHGGWAGVRAWLAAKFLNNTGSSAGPNISTPGATLPNQGGGSGANFYTGPTGSRLVPIPGHPGEYSIEPTAGTAPGAQSA